MTSDGGVTWRLVKGLSGYRSAVAYVPGITTPTIVALGPSGSDCSTDDGRSWNQLEGPGFDTLSFARGKSVGWGAGAKGSLGHLMFTAVLRP